jgi:peptidoglycan/xylan/chitin deacetylase (PgdA/CDA1 family)
MSHQPLTSLNQPSRRADIEQGRALCSGLTDRPISGFAYPHGERDAETIAMVREAGFEWACSTRAASIDSENYELFDLPRVAAPDVPGAMMLHAIEATTP